MKYKLTLGSVSFQLDELSVELKDVQLEAEIAREDLVRYLDAVFAALELASQQEPVSTLN